MTMETGQTAREIILRRLDLLGKELCRPELSAATDETHLIGAQSPLDSIGLVTLIADLEGDILQATGKSVTLADEKAMSLTLSPFRRVGTLVDYVDEKLRQAG